MGDTIDVEVGRVVGATTAAEVGDVKESRATFGGDELPNEEYDCC